MKNNIMAILALLLIGACGLAWHQYQELIGLRVLALGSGAPFDPQRRLTDERRQIGQLQAELSVLRGRLNQADAAAAGGAAATEEVAPPVKAGAADGLPPEVRRRMLREIDRQYATLWARLKLSPAQVRQFAEMLLDKQLTGMDVAQSLKSQGIDPKDNHQVFVQAANAARAAADGEIQSAFGGDAFAQYQQYERTLPQRNFVYDSVQPFLGKTGSALTPDQAEQMVQILAQNPSNVIMSKQALAAAVAVLTPGQAQSLEKFQQLQQVQLNLMKQLGQVQRQLNPPPARPAGSG
jgi:hypothetical protein